MSAKSQSFKNRVFYVSFASGTSTWGYDKGELQYHGLYDPRFSRVESVWQGTYPDPGLEPGKVPLMVFGERLGQDMLDALPKTIPVGGHTPNTAGKHPRDINILTDGEFGSNKIVSQRLKDVIEELEPGVHQFVPFSFVNCVTGEPIWTDIPWYYLNITTWIAPDVLFDWEAMGDAVKIEELPPRGHASGHRIMMSFPLWFDYKQYLVRRSAVESDLRSKHLWVTSRYYKAIDRPVLIQPAAFCSETFQLACKAAGLKGGHFTKLKVNWDRHG